ncbi:MAG: alginate export family protein [Candidatus Omnitrophota bacterium]
MSKKLILLVAFMSLALLGSSFAAVENIKVSGDIKSGAITRNLSLGSTTPDTKDQEDFLFSQIRLRFDADLTEGVSAVVGLINERIWGDNSYATTVGEDNADDVDLNLAYIQLNEFMDQPLTVKIGRQNLYFGSGLIVGDPDTNRLVSDDSPTAIADQSLRKSFDALRATLDYAPYTIDMIYTKIEENETQSRDDITLMGANVAYDWASYNGLTEGYFFYQQGTDSEQASDEDDDHIWVLGARAQMDPNDNWTLGAEGAYQGGEDQNSDTRKAWAAIVNADYRFLNDYNAKLGFKYTYLSGDDDNDDDAEAWSPMSEDQTPAEIINILMSNSNAHYLTLTGSMMPREDITLSLLYTHAMLAEDYTDSTLDGAGVTNNAEYFVKTNEKHFGDEVDICALYDYTEDVQLKLTGAIFTPGEVFEDANDDTAYSLQAGINVDF